MLVLWSSSHVYLLSPIDWFSAVCSPFLCSSFSVNVIYNVFDPSTQNPLLCSHHRNFDRSLLYLYFLHHSQVTFVEYIVNRNIGVFGKDVYRTKRIVRTYWLSMQIFVPIAPSHPGLDCDKLQGSDKSMLREYTKVLSIRKILYIVKTLRITVDLSESCCDYYWRKR